MNAEDLFAPGITIPLITADQVSKVLATPRATTLAWINRYPGLGIEPVAKGSTRLFTFQNVGMLTALRLALSAGPIADSLFEIGDSLTEHLRAAYREMASTLRLEQYREGEATHQRPYIAERASPFNLAGQMLFRNEWTLGLYPATYNGVTVKDLAGYPTPILVLPLDAALRNAWTRALWVIHGIEWND